MKKYPNIRGLVWPWCFHCVLCPNQQRINFILCSMASASGKMVWARHFGRNQFLKFHIIYNFIYYIVFILFTYRLCKSTIESYSHTHTHRTHECRVVYTMFILVERFWSASDFFFVCNLTLHWFVRSPGWIQNVLENDCALDCRASDVYIWGCTFVSFGNDNGLGVFGVSWLSYSCRRIDFAIIIIMAMKVPHKHTHI